jgi:hypothetical protein
MYVSSPCNIGKIKEVPLPPPPLSIHFDTNMLTHFVRASNFQILAGFLAFFFIFLLLGGFFQELALFIMTLFGSSAAVVV